MSDDQFMTSSYHKPIGVFGTKIPSSICFAVGLLLFLLPFAELRCKPNSKALSSFNVQITGSNTGWGLALGTEWNFHNSPYLNPYGEDKEMPSDTHNKKGLDPNVYAIVALSLSLISFCLSFVNTVKAATINSITGFLAAGALIGLMFDLIRQSKHFINEKTNAPDEVIHSTLVFTPWFYVCIVIFLVASFFSYKRMQLLKRSPSPVS